MNFLGFDEFTRFLQWKVFEILDKHMTHLHQDHILF